MNNNNYFVERYGISVTFNDKNERDEFLDLREFYSGFFIDTMAFNISKTLGDKEIKYSDLTLVYTYQEKLWKIITYYICIWEESLIADFNRKYKFKEGSKKKYYDSNQRKKGQLYVDNLELNYDNSDVFYQSFEESFGVFRAICCNPDIRGEYTYKLHDWHTHIRFIDKINKYRNKVIHDVYVLFDKKSRNGTSNKLKQIESNLAKLYTYLPSFHRKRFLFELSNINQYQKNSLLDKEFSIDVARLKSNLNIDCKISNHLSDEETEYLKKLKLQLK